MKKFYRLADGTQPDVEAIRHHLPNVGIPDAVEDLSEFGYEPFADSAPPAQIPLGKKAVKGTPKKTGDTWDWDWQIVSLTPAEVAATMPTQAEYSAAMDRHFDAVAQTKRYSNRMTCAMRAGYPGVYQAEGLAFGVWMDDCNQFAYALLGQVLTGQVPQPTLAGFIAALPVIAWPT